MKKISLFISTIIFFTVNSCNKTNDHSLTSDDYNRAAKHLSKNLNKDMFSVLISNKWENEDFLNFSIKGEKNIKNFKIDLKTNKKSISQNNIISKKSNLKNTNEFISPNGQLAAFIENYNLWLRNLKTNVTTQLTFDGKVDYGYATNNAGWIKNDDPVLK